MALPLILAGPILRRVQTESVSVWVATKSSAHVTLNVYQGFGNGQAPPEGMKRGTGSADTVRIGENFHVVVVTATLQAPNLLVSGTTYSYDLRITPDGSAQVSLHDLGLLAAQDLSEHDHVPLGYVTNQLPSFSLPPQDLENLRLVHASCRKPHGPQRDALAYADAMINDAVTAPNDRPHMLFLTGDQIYADDVSVPLLPHITALAADLFAGTPERIAIPPQNGVTSLEVNQAEIPAGLRQTFVHNVAGFTSSDAHCHLLSLGEYCGHYLMSWNAELWPAFPDPLPSLDKEEEPPNVDLLSFGQRLEHLPASASALNETAEAFFGGMGGDFDPEVRKSFLAHLFGLGRAADGTPSKLAKVLKDLDADLLKPKEVGKALKKHKNQADLQPTLEFADLMAPAEQRLFHGFYKDFRKTFRHLHRYSIRERGRLIEFYRTLPNVRRVLANVPTYMIWDDHDLTDDWNVSSLWIESVEQSACGSAILRNGMAAYVLFQDWGNRPEDYDENGVKRPLLDDIAKLFASGEGPWPVEPAATTVETAFARSGDQALPWHYAFEGPDFKGLVLNTRTEREFDSHLSPPNLIPLIGDAGPLARQIPRDPMIQKGQVLVVISPVPVLGIPVMEQVGQTAAVAAINFALIAKGGKPDAATMLEAEAWALHREGFEQLLLRLAPQRRVVFLSGDLHYGAAARLDHWRKDGADATATHFVQFTSSPSRNAWPDEVIMATESFGVAHRMLELHGTVERMGWLEPEPSTLAFEPGTDFPFHLLLATENKPVLIPVYPDHPLWQGISSLRPPDLTWRQTLLRDERPDLLPETTDTPPENPRPPTAAPIPLSDDLDLEKPLIAYQEVLARHAAFIDKRAFTRSTLWLTNIGVVRFENPDGTFEAVQELWAVSPGEPGSARAVVMSEYRTELAPAEPDRQPVLPGDT